MMTSSKLPWRYSVQDLLGVKIIGIAGKAGAGKDTLYNQVLKPKGFIRWQMTLHYKIWLVSTGRATWDEVFVSKPKHVRKILQEEITDLRDVWTENIWLDVFRTWLIGLKEIVGVEFNGVAVTDLRFLIEMRGIKFMGGKVIHIEAPDQQANVAPELRGHRSEVELDSPEVKMLRDAYLFNRKDGTHKLRRAGELILKDWGWN
jgi:dephospho-CoA kinase